MLEMFLFYLFKVEYDWKGRKNIKKIEKGTYPRSSCLDVAKVPHVFCPALEIGDKCCVRPRQEARAQFLVGTREGLFLVRSREEDPRDGLQLHHWQAPLGKKHFRLSHFSFPVLISWLFLPSFGP